MEKFIRVGDVEVNEKSCMVDFAITCDLDDFQHFTVTHSKLYQLLETATDVKIANGGAAISFKQGIISFKAFLKK